MHISEDHYDDRQRLQLALRFLTHEARTQTIQLWTGLTEHRIRYLYKTQLSDAACYVPRHRGRSPHQAAYFMRSPKLQQEASTLAGLYAQEELLPAEPSAEAAAALPGVTSGYRLCTAFEAYTVMVPSASISFEYAVFLIQCLARGDLLRLGKCSGCGGLIVVDRFPVRDRLCRHCAAAPPG